MTTGPTYTLARGGQRYGPYTLEQLREYVSQGSVQMTDLVWCAGMTTWSPVSAVIGASDEPGSIPPVVPPPIPGSPVPPGSTPYEATGYSSAALHAKPPSLHWGLVLLISIVTCGVFGLVWMILQAVWVRKLEPSNNALIVLAVGIPAQFVLGFAGGVMGDDGGAGMTLLGYLVGFVTTQVAYFSMREVLQNKFVLQLSGVMTFFFNFLYLQFHMTRIAKGEVAVRQ